MSAITETSLRRIGAGLAILGVAIATYITIAHAAGSTPACLAGGQGCQTVADSSYSHLAGISVSVIGLAGYVCLLAAMVAGGDAARFAGFMLALVGFGFSVYLTYLELFVIDAICQWCVASAVVMTALLVVSALRVFRFAGSDLGQRPADST